MKVLVTETQVRSALSVIRSLGKRGITVYAGDHDKISTGFFSKYTKKSIVYPDVRKDEDGFIEAILQFVKSEKIDVIFPIIEESIIALLKNRELFEKHTIIPFTDLDKLLQAMDKSQTFKLAESLDLPIPKTYYPQTVKDLEEINIYPVVLKPTISAGSRGLSVCNNRNELNEAFQQNVERYKKFIVQDYIPDINGEKVELCWYGFYDWDSKLKAHGCYKVLRTYPINCGPATYKVSIENEEVNRIATKILDHLQWQGLALIDFRVDPRDNIPKMLEINPRLWASCEHSIRAGFDLPGMWLDFALKKKIPVQEPIKVGVKSRNIIPGEMLWLLSSPSIKNIKEFFHFNGAHYDVIQRGDLKPVFGSFMASVLYLLDKEKRNAIIR